VIPVISALGQRQLARAQQHQQLAAGAVDPDHRQPALLQVDAGARQFRHHRREVRLVADDQQPTVSTQLGQQCQRLPRVEAPRERRVDLQSVALLLAPRLRRHRRGAQRALLRTAPQRLELHPHPRDRRARQPRLALPPLRQTPLGVRSGSVRLGVRVA
jgi:hypothetical protein